MASRTADRGADEHSPSGDPWQDFLQRPAAFFALLDEAGLTRPAGTAARGDLGDDLIAQVEAFTLDTSRLSASLRGFQRFAAAFALLQQRVVIGDEMGLGRTVEALATFAHIAGTTPRSHPALPRHLPRSGRTTGRS